MGRETTICVVLRYILHSTQVLVLELMLGNQTKYSQLPRGEREILMTFLQFQEEKENIESEIVGEETTICVVSNHWFVDIVSCICHCLKLTKKDTVYIKRFESSGTEQGHQ